MPEYMLDTDTVSFALRGQGRVAARLLEHRPSQLCLRTIALAELRFGAERRRSRRLHHLITTFVASVQAVAFDQRAADRFGTVATALARRGDRHVRHPHGGARPFIGPDVRHEQH
jgi:tRNA(fMet)-specific endonuclease VapC